MMKGRTMHNRTYFTSMVALHKPPTTKDIPPDGFKHIEGWRGETKNEENAEKFEGLPKHAPDVDPKVSMQRLLRKINQGADEGEIERKKKGEDVMKKKQEKQE